MCVLSQSQDHFLYCYCMMVFCDLHDSTQPDDEGAFACSTVTSSATTNPVTDIHDPGHAAYPVVSVLGSVRWVGLIT